MGQAISIESKYCITVPEALCQKEYTVQRTSGELDDGWRIQVDYYENEDTIFPFPRASRHAKSSRKGLENWRVLMEKGSPSSQEYMYAWRRVNSIYPSELHGDEDAIKEWQDKTATMFEELEVIRVAEGGKTPESELKEIEARIGQGLAAIAQLDEERMASYAEDGK